MGPLERGRGRPRGDPVRGTTHGSETYIQSGVLRGSHRKLARGSTPLLPLHTSLEEDAEPLPADEFVEARVELFPFADVLRTGL